MNRQHHVLARFHQVLPAVREWIDSILEEHKHEIVVVSSLGFRGLPQHFPQQLLDRAKVISVPSVPFPPLMKLGLPELSHMERMPLGGITYKDTFFVQESQRSESLHFHELVHVVQWERLGVDNFLLAYGVGLLQFEYEDSPLERMAYVLQQSFERGAVPPNLVGLIHNQTDGIWRQVAPLVQKGQ